MKNREFVRKFKKFRGPLNSLDFILSFAFLVVLLVFPLLYYLVDIFALFYIPLFILPMFYAVQHMLMLTRINKDVAPKQFRAFFLQGLDAKVRKTFQSGKTFLWSVLVFIVAEIFASIIIYSIMERIDPSTLSVLDEAYNLLLAASQNNGDLTAFTEYILANEMVLFPYLLVSTTLPTIIAGIFATLRLYRQAFFCFYAAHMTVIDAKQVEPSLRTPYASFRREHYRYIFMMSIIPLMLFILAFSGTSYLLATFVAQDIRLILTLSSMAGFIVVMPFFPQLLLSNAFMYEIFSQRYLVVIARSLHANAQLMLTLPGLDNNKKNKIERYIVDLEHLIEINAKKPSESSASENIDEPEK